ncbi:hypothetical protein [Alteromonas oceanisediminis]|uniref:hypothetical protein n=1 Tax=Alteromonas oceanisediminis TaxID=2836180 RepID=UPI001BD9E8EC|nr:hypothetical protein [Alteromonas oceanisediminis]MBT0585232.1 hypothetical protein [Alteromonas oceanisediminis]
MKRVVLLTTVALAFSVHSAPVAISACPTTFESLPLPEGATLCREFSPSAEQTGRSLSFYVPMSPQSTVEYFQRHSLRIHSSVNQHTLMMAQQDDLRVAISTDRQGSQIDILVL